MTPGTHGHPADRRPQRWRPRLRPLARGGASPWRLGTPVVVLLSAGFGSAATNFSTGVGTWNTAGVATGAAAETRTYQLTYTVKSDTTNDTQGGTAALGFTWEAQNS